MGYLTIDGATTGEVFDRAWLDAQPAVWESDLVRHIRSTEPLSIKLDGLHSIGVVEKG